MYSATFVSAKLAGAPGHAYLGALPPDLNLQSGIIVSEVCNFLFRRAVSLFVVWSWAVAFLPLLFVDLCWSLSLLSFVLVAIVALFSVPWPMLL